MTLTFIQHELKAFWRSKNTGKSIAIRLVLGFFIFILFLYVLAIGFFMKNFLAEVSPESDLTVAFSGIILYYFLVDLFMRSQLQELPTLRVQPYLLLPIKKNTIVKYLSFASLQSFFNLWPIVLFTPFICRVIIHHNGAFAALAFFLAVIGFTVFNNYLSLYIKRKANLNGWIFLGFAAILILIGLCDFLWHLISVSQISGWFFTHLLAQPVWALIPIALAVLMFYVNFLYLKQNLYLEELSSRKKDYRSSTEIPLLGRFGKVGDLVANEIKLILRNKRPKSALTMGLFFLCYGLIFYTNKVYGESFKVFCGTFMVGIFIITYGQFLYAWQSSHFDGILVSKVNFKDFLRAKFLLFTIVSTTAFILTTPYIYFGWHVILVHFVMLLWSVGVNTTIVLYFANRNYKRIDLSKGASFNWEGVGATQMLLGLPMFILPFIIYGPLAFFKHPDIGLAILAAIGLLFILTRSYWIKLLEADFKEKKYKIAEGFRNK